jgi:hypothetical protein
MAVLRTFSRGIEAGDADSGEGVEAMPTATNVVVETRKPVKFTASPTA